MAVVSLPAMRRLAPRRRHLTGLILTAWVALAAVLHGRDTLDLGRAQLTGLHQSFNDAIETIDASRNSSPVFLYFFNYIRLFIDHLVTFTQALISQPSFGRPVPVLGWLGVTAVATAVAYLWASRRIAVLTAAGFVSFGLLGLWQESMDTLALTLTAIALSLGIGIPLGIWAGLSDRFNRLVTPVLDVMQTMPTFVYLAPLTLFFLIGPASATIATMIYAIPPAIRITAHGIREVAPVTVEAATAQGATGLQLLRTVRLPLAKRTIVEGVNQTIMAALAMATVAALIDAPGLGRTVLQALESLDVGTAFNAGIALVVMAIVLDRVTTAASRRADAAPSPTSTRRTSTGRTSTGRTARWRRVEVGAVLAVTAVAAYLSYVYVWAAQFPQGADFGSYVRRAADAASTWAQDSLAAFTTP